MVWLCAAAWILVMIDSPGKPQRRLCTRPLRVSVASSQAARPGSMASCRQWQVRPTAAGQSPGVDDDGGDDEDSHRQRRAVVVDRRRRRRQRMTGRRRSGVAGGGRRAQGGVERGSRGVRGSGRLQRSSRRRRRGRCCRWYWSTVTTSVFVERVPPTFAPSHVVLSRRTESLWRPDKGWSWKTRRSAVTRKTVLNSRRCCPPRLYVMEGHTPKERRWGAHFSFV